MIAWYFTSGNVNGFQTTDVFQTQPICSCVYTNRSSKFILSERKDITNDSNDKCDCIPDVTDRQQVGMLVMFNLCQRVDMVYKSLL